MRVERGGIDVDRTVRRFRELGFQPYLACAECSEGERCPVCLKYTVHGIQVSR